MSSALRVTGATGPHDKDINGIYVHDGYQNQVSVVVSLTYLCALSVDIVACAQTKLYRKYDSYDWWVQ